MVGDWQTGASRCSSQLDDVGQVKELDTRKLVRFTCKANGVHALDIIKLLMEY